jgi:hypothetical protein
MGLMVMRINFYKRYTGREILMHLVINNNQYAALDLLTSIKI